MSILITLREIDQARSWYREAAKAVIKGSLKHGSIQQLADKLNVSKQYLSAVISGYEDYPPSLDFIRRLGNELPIDNDIRDRLQHYLEFSYERRKALHSFPSTRVMQQDELEYDLHLLRSIFHTSLYSHNAEAVRDANRQFYETAQIVAMHLQIYNPIESAVWWLHLAGKALILFRPDEAIIFANRGLVQLRSFIHGHYKESDAVTNVLINLLLAQASAYHHLHWYRESHRLREKVWVEINKRTDSPKDWHELFYREYIPTVIKLPRWSLRTIADQVAQTKQYMIDNGDNITDLLQLEKTLASAYLAAEKAKESAKLMQPYLDLVDSGNSRNLQPILKVMVLRTITDIYWDLGSRSDWSDYAIKTAKEAQSHGFVHQNRTLLARYGSDIERLL